VLRLSQGEVSQTVEVQTNICEWLPGDVWLSGQVRVPEALKPGEVMLHAGLIDPETETPKVRFAVEETDDDGWVPLGNIEVT